MTVHCMALFVFCKNSFSFISGRSTNGGRKPKAETAGHMAGAASRPTPATTRRQPCVTGPLLQSLAAIDSVTAPSAITSPRVRPRGPRPPGTWRALAHSLPSRDGPHLQPGVPVPLARFLRTLLLSLGLSFPRSKASSLSLFVRDSPFVFPSLATMGLGVSWYFFEFVLAGVCLRS